MKEETFNSKFRNYAKKLSPTGEDREFVSKIYNFFCNLLGENKCLQIGSYPRFTAIRPLHDLDILHILGGWDKNDSNPQRILQELKRKIEEGNYKNPTNYKTKISVQTHSVTVKYNYEGKVIFSVDIVPAYIFSQNEFNQDTYKVPEIIQKKHGEQRIKLYEQLSKEMKEMKWIHTDPRGYIEVAKDTNQTNKDFRKTVKIVKEWKNKLKEKHPHLGLKSFHLEQVIAKHFQETPGLEIFDGIFNFFCNIPQIIDEPQIKDRANNGKYIDEYLNDLNEGQKQKIVQARDCFLIDLENFTENDSISKLMESRFYERIGDSEEFLFDCRIPIFTEQSIFWIDGFIRRKPGFRDGWLSEVDHKIAKNREISFRIKREVAKDYTIWKVQNDKKSGEVLSKKCTRGEMTKNQTLRNPEETLYRGSHYVECFVIKNDVCIARSKINVIIQ